MAEISDLDPTDANNVGRWPENMLGGGINDAGRADEGILARWYRDADGSRVASGAANAFSVTSTRTISALTDNIVMAFTANHTITGAATLNLNGLGARGIKRYNGLDLAAGDIVSGQPLLVIYKQAANVWFMMSAPAALTGQMFEDFGENAPTNPVADTARLYAVDDGGRPMLAYRNSAGLVTPLPGGAIIDRRYTENATFIGVTTQIPIDDSVPQSNEGIEVIALTSPTLKKGANRLRIRAIIPFSFPDNVSRFVAALFRDGDPNAAATVWKVASFDLAGGGARVGEPLVLEHEQSPGGVGPFTYRIRVGSSNATINGEGGRLFGGTSRMTMIIEEIHV